MLKSKCVLVYGLSEEEIKKLKKINFKVIKIEKNMSFMKIKDILNKKEVIDEESSLPKEKVILFNGYGQNQLRTTIKSVRNIITGGILAVVTPISINWTFERLISHLILERELVDTKGREK
ncbi:MAG: DUF3783 domain-containing protein [Clostridium sp.]